MATVGWVDSRSLKEMLSSPGPWTPEEEHLIQVTVDAVNSYIHRVRPDLAPGTFPPSPLPASGPAFSSAFAAPFTGTVAEVTGRDVYWAALQLALRWYQKRALAQLSGFEEMGPLPPFVDKDIEEALEIGRSHAPVVA